MKRPASRLPLIALAILLPAGLLAGCGESEPASQQALCKVIEQARKDYRAAVEDPNQLAGEKRKAELIAQTRQALGQAVPGGKVEGWLVSFEVARGYNMDTRNTAYARFRFACGTFGTPSAMTADKVNLLQPDSPVYASVMALRSDQKIKLSGTLIPDFKGKYAFHELSVTESGAFNAPEFAIRLERIEPR